MDVVEDAPEKVKGKKKESVYEAGELVLARDGNRMYEAKVVKVHEYKGSRQYFLHYTSWAPKFDTWRTPDFMCKMNDFANEHTGKKSKGKKGGATKRKASGEAGHDEGGEEDEGNDGDEGASSATMKSHRMRMTGMLVKGLKEETTAMEKVGATERAQAHKQKLHKLYQQDLSDDEEESSQLKIVFPLKTKKNAVSEWSLLRNEPRRLLVLPRPVTVEAVLNQFVDSKKEKADDTQLGGYQSLMDGIKAYFNMALPLILLYRCERQQYEQLVAQHPRKAPAQLYGVEHLMRLMIKMPGLIANALVGQTELAQMQARLNELIKFIEKSRLFDAQAFEPVNDLTADDSAAAAAAAAADDDDD
jgi:mortality factor 4-like protein 1